MLDGLKVGGDKTRAYVKDQFNYREHFAAERLRLEGVKAAPKKVEVLDARNAASQKQADFRPEHPLSEYQLKTTDTPQSRATFEKYLAERRANLTREEVLTVKDEKLLEQMDWLYREKAKIPPYSTAAAYRHEKVTGELVGGSRHDLKTQESIPFLERWLKNTPSASSHDRSIAEQVLKDLQNAEFLK
jgi:hypothetical protein